MSLDFNAFDEAVFNPEENLNEVSEGVLNVIYEVLSFSQAAAIDYSKFTFADCWIAMESIMHYAGDENETYETFISTNDTFELVDYNRNNLLYEINRIAHIHQIVSEMKVKSKFL